MGIETIIPVAAAVLIFLLWRAFHPKGAKTDGTPTDPNAPKGDSR